MGTGITWALTVLDIALHWLWTFLLHCSAQTAAADSYVWRDLEKREEKTLILWVRLKTVSDHSNTVEPRFNEPLFNEVLDVTNEILRPGQIYSKMYETEPRFNELFDITNIIRKPKRKVYLDITNYSVSTLNIRHTTADKRWTDVSKSFYPYGKDQETETFQSTAYFMS